MALTAELCLALPLAAAGVFQRASQLPSRREAQEAGEVEAALAVHLTKLGAAQAPHKLTKQAAL